MDCGGEYGRLRPHCAKDISHVVARMVYGKKSGYTYMRRRLHWKKALWEGTRRREFSWLSKAFCMRYGVRVDGEYLQQYSGMY